MAGRRTASGRTRMEVLFLLLLLLLSPSHAIPRWILATRMPLLPPPPTTTTTTVAPPTKSSQSTRQSTHHNNNKRRWGRDNKTQLDAYAPWTTSTQDSAEDATTTASSSTTPPPVHLMQTTEQQDTQKHNNQTRNNNTVAVLQYTHTDGTTYTSLNTSPDKFCAYLHHVLYGVSLLSHKSVKSSWRYTGPQHRNRHKKPPTPAHLVTTHVVPTAAHRQAWRRAWEDERLLTDRTELLAVYPSDEDAAQKQRGGFADHLYLYTERFRAIQRDEHQLLHRVYEDSSSPSGKNHASHHNYHHHHRHHHHHEQYPNYLLQWLRHNYPHTDALQQCLQPPPLNEDGTTLQHHNTKELTLHQLQRFLQWFRDIFPYYYHQCAACGAPESTTFLGYTYPNATELTGHASRTELYECQACHALTRFPRYNSAPHVLEAQRGRCGEYSVLLWEFLRALGAPDVRWIVDWADHVWTEVRLPVVSQSLRHPSTTKISYEWIHLDPCEAAVDDKLLYQGWGKTPTFVVAFYAPLPGSFASDVLPIQDVTAEYTTATPDEIQQRRGSTDGAAVTRAIRQATEWLQQQQPPWEGPHE